MNKLGIVQGRLTHPREGHQTTPSCWNFEFDKLEDLELTHIEWVIDDSNLLTNPLLNKGRPLWATGTLDKISSVCLDHIVNENIFDERYFKNNVYPICGKLHDLGVKRVTIPILEGSRIRGPSQLNDMKSILYNLIKKFGDFEFCIETDNDIETLQKLLKTNPRLCVTYDTGNLTAMNYSHSKYIEAVHNRIRNVHLKDRIAGGGRSVSGFTGDTPFKLIFELLKHHNYDGNFTLQMARGIPGQEEKAISNYVKEFRSMYES